MRIIIILTRVACTCQPLHNIHLRFHHHRRAAEVHLLKLVIDGFTTATVMPVINVQFGVDARTGRYVFYVFFMFVLLLMLVMTVCHLAVVVRVVRNVLSLFVAGDQCACELVWPLRTRFVQISKHPELFRSTVERHARTRRNHCAVKEIV